MEHTFYIGNVFQNEQITVNGFCPFNICVLDGACGLQYCLLEA